MEKPMAQHVQNLRRASTSDLMGRALALSGRRWALRVVWELRVGPLNFRALQAACGNISPSVLQRRLHELRDQRIIEKIPRLGYRLSTSGEKLFLVLAQLDKWSVQLPDDWLDSKK
jgi:DNA-binding HxlR family transcriptional regulator